MLLVAVVGVPLFGRQAALLGAAVFAGGLVIAGEARIAKTDAVLLATILLAQAVLARLYLRRISGRGAAFVFWLGVAACALLLVAILADAPVRDLARSLAPSVVAVLRVVTEFGNSAWPIGLSLIGIAAVATVSRAAHPFPPEALRNLRSALLLVPGSVAVSGFLARLTKNMIGRARPSTEDAMVFEFAAMTFRAGWAAFPSGHATTAIACAIALAAALPRLAFAWIALGILTALSRAFLGAHWLTDCLAGLALGTVVTLALKRRLEQRGHSFAIDPALLPPVLFRAGRIGIGRLWRGAETAIRLTRDRVARKAPS